MTEQSLLRHPPIQRALDDPATHAFLKEIMSSAASRDPVDVLSDLDIARDLIASYLGALVAPHMARSATRLKPIIC
jgi:hypothetical protein